ncbi:MAG: TolC family protein [Bacteriovoracaceae bacterium]|nr:TolC family protein [Bacteriovoracaceae bacterium]
MILTLVLISLFNPSQAITLNEIQSLALERSAALSVEEMEARALSHEATLKGKWQNPQLMGQIGSLKSGPTKGATVEFSVVQAVPLSNKFGLRKEIAQIALSQQERQSETMRKWVTHQALLSAWRVSLNQELLDHGIERAHRLSLIKSYLESTPKVSIKQRVEISIINSLLLQLEKMQDVKKHDLFVAKGDLEFWTGKVIEAKEINLHLPDLKKITQDWNISIAQDVELMQAENKLKMAKLDKDLSVKEQRPDIFFGAGYRVENVEPVNHFSYGIIGLNIPLWDSGKERVETAKARFVKDQKFYEEAQRRTELKHKNQIEMVRYNFEQLKRFPPELVHKNEKAIHEAETGFRQGQLDVNTFLQVETQSHEVIDQVFISWMSFLENLSSLQLMKNENFVWENKL